MMADTGREEKSGVFEDGDKFEEKEYCVYQTDSTKKYISQKNERMISKEREACCYNRGYEPGSLLEKNGTHGMESEYPGRNERFNKSKNRFERYYSSEERYNRKRGLEEHIGYRRDERYYPHFEEHYKDGVKYQKERPYFKYGYGRKYHENLEDLKSKKMHEHSERDFLHERGDLSNNISERHMRGKYYAEESIRNEEFYKSHPPSAQYPRADYRYNEKDEERRSSEYVGWKRGRREHYEDFLQKVPHELERDYQKPKKFATTSTPPSRAIGLFGLSIYATEDDIKDFLKERISEIQNYKIMMIHDRYKGTSKGYGFVYFDSLDDAITSKNRLSGLSIKGKDVRIDFSTSRQLKFIESQGI